MNNYKIQHECINNIRAAVIERAICDYREALRNNRYRKAFEIERFFRSEEGQAFTRGNGIAIIKRVREEEGINDNWGIYEENED